jgi:hypothetical protein
MRRMPADQTGSHIALIDAYFDIVATDAYERFSEIITDDCTFSLMPIGHTFKGKKDVMHFVMTSGGARKHDRKSTIAISNWFTDGVYFCVEYDHSSIVRFLRRRITIDGYCMVFHMTDGKFDEIREYINPSSIAGAMLTTLVLRLLPFASRMRSARSGR